MGRTWQQTHNNILKRAQMLHFEVMTIQADVTAEAIADMAYDRKCHEKEKEGNVVQIPEHHTRTLCRYIRSKLSPDVIMATEAVQVHGMIGPNEHSWFKVGPDAETLAQEGYERVQPNWFYIIDPQCPEVTPQVLLVGPGSPLMLMYMAQQEIPWQTYQKNRK